MDIQELLMDTDILVTDYSSTYIDYLLLDRPVVFYNFDYQDYLAYYDAYSKLKDYRQTSMYIDDIFILLPGTEELLTANYSIISMDDTYQRMIDSYLESKKSFFNNRDECWCV